MGKRCPFDRFCPKCNKTINQSQPESQIQGEIDFTIANKRCYLDKMVDTFSENKRSKFFLLNSFDRSYVDFFGNFHIYISMKQYVLLKFTENFILSIEGNYQKPDIRLRKKHWFFDH